MSQAGLLETLLQLHPLHPLPGQRKYPVCNPPPGQRQFQLSNPRTTTKFSPPPQLPLLCPRNRYTCSEYAKRGVSSGEKIIQGNTTTTEIAEGSASGMRKLGANGTGQGLGKDEWRYRKERPTWELSGE